MHIRQAGIRFISIHALCEEGDADTTDKSKQRMEFLSTPSARRATQTVVLPAVEGVISIHALCEEGDEYLYRSYHTLGGISIHALCEEGDLQTDRVQVENHTFLSTPSARRATLGAVAQEVET